MSHKVWDEIGGHLVGRIDTGRSGSLPMAPDGTFVVRRGDTLWGIADALGVSLQELRRLNPQVKNPNLIRIGERLQLPVRATDAETPATAVVPAEASAAPAAPPAAAEHGAAPAGAPVASPEPNAVVTGARPALRGAPAAPGESSGMDQAVSGANRLFARWVQTDHNVSETLDLGAFGKGTMSLRSSSTKEHGYDAGRMKFAEVAEAQGKQAVFVKTEGTLTANGSRSLPSASGNSNVNFGANVTAEFAMTRGHLLDKKRPDGAALARDMARTSLELPLSAERAKKLEPGAALTLTLRGDANVDATTKLESTSAAASASARGRIAVSARFLGAGKVEVEVQRSSGADASARVGYDKDGRQLSGRTETSATRDQTFNYTLDLATPAGAAAYEALLRGETSSADADAKVEKSGVTRGYSWGTKVRDNLAEVRGGIGGTELLPTRVSGTATSTSRTSVDLESGNKTTRRALRADVTLTTPIDEGTTLGIVADAARTTELMIPGKDKAEAAALYELPLDGDKALALPSGARFEISGRGAIGATVKTKSEKSVTDDDGNTLRSRERALDLGLTRRGNVDIVVTRGEGSAATLNVTVRSTVQRDIDPSVKRTRGAVSVGLAATDRRTTIKEETATVTLDLDKPEHKAAYAAALRGDLGPARELGGDAVKDRALWSRDTDVTATVEVTDGPRVEAQWHREVLTADDWRVTTDENRVAVLAAAKARGEEVSWVSLTTKIAPGARVSVGTGIKTGFDASYERTVTAVLPEGKETRLMTSVPKTAGDLLALPRGAEVTSVGRGTISALSGLTQGVDVEAAVARVSASVSVTHEQTLVDRTIDVGIKRLDGDKVEIRFDTRRASSNKTSLDARVGVDVNMAVVPGAGAIQKLPLGGSVVSATEQIIERNLSLGLLAERGRTKSKQTGLTATIDLSKPENRTAAEALLQGNPEPVLAIAAREKRDAAVAAAAAAAAKAEAAKAAAEAAKAEAAAAKAAAAEFGVELPEAAPKATPAADDEGEDEATPEGPKPSVTIDVVRDGTRTERSRKLALTVGGDAVFLREALRSESTMVEAWNNGTITTTSLSTFLANTRNFVSSGDLRVAAVRVSTSDKPEGKNYFQVSLTARDSWTSKRDMKEVVALGEALGAKPVRPMVIEADEGRNVRKILGSAAKHGTTRTDIELFVTQKGIDALRTKTGEELRGAYASFLGRIDGKPPPWAGPKAAEATALIREWNRVRGFDDREAEGVRASYWHTFKRNIFDDAPSLESADALEKAVDAIRASDDPLVWNRTFANLGQRMEFDIMGAVAAINQVVGDEQILVHRFNVKGRSVDIEMKDEGLLSQ